MPISGDEFAKDWGYKDWNDLAMRERGNPKFFKELKDELAKARGYKGGYEEERVALEKRNRELQQQRENAQREFEEEQTNKGLVKHRGFIKEGHDAFPHFVERWVTPEEARRLEEVSKERDFVPNIENKPKSQPEPSPTAHAPASPGVRQEGTKMADENKDGRLRELELEKAEYEREERERQRREREDKEEKERKEKSSIGGLAARASDKVKKHSGTGIVIFAFLLFLADFYTEYKGFQIEDIGSVFAIFQLIGSLAYVIGIWAFFFWFLSRDRSLKTLVTFILILIIVIISLAFAFKFDPFSVLHVFFILIFWMGFVKPTYEDVSRANIFLIAVLIIDLYAYSIFNAFLPDYVHLLRGFPFLFIITIVYVWQQTRSLLALFFMIGVVGWYFLMGGPEFAEKLNLTGIDIVGTVFPPLKDIPQKLIVEPFKKISEATSAWLSGRIQYAITGKVEENEFEPLGVYLENVQSADKKYYEDEKVVVWGTAKARTLDDPINIKVGCFVKKDDKKILADKTDPDKKFSVFTLEELDFACTFGSCNLVNDPLCKNLCDPQKDSGCKTAVQRKILKIGRNTIKTFADFNFETLAFLKVYFINRERQHAMVREELDPFEEFAIDDKNPVAVYTNGPAKIEMGTNSPLVSVSNDYIVEPSLDIRIDNREGWQGRINSLREFVLFLPDGVGMKSEKDENGRNIYKCGNRVFVDYRIDNCRASCTEFVEKECKEVCNGFTDLEEKQKCDNECIERKGVCEESCGSFFAEGGQSYKGYALDVKDIKYIDESKDFEKGKLFRCRFKPDPNAVLGASPFTTKSFRVKVRYNYTVEKDAAVEIVELPKELGISAPVIPIIEEPKINEITDLIATESLEDWVSFNLVDGPGVILTLDSKDVKEGKNSVNAELAKAPSIWMEREFELDYLVILEQTISFWIKSDVEGEVKILLDGIGVTDDNPERKIAVGSSWQQYTFTKDELTTLKYPGYEGFQVETFDNTIKKIWIDGLSIK